MFERIKEMDRRTLVPLLLAVVLGLLLFSNVIGGIRQAGWNEGYIAGLLTNGGENAKAVMPYLGYQGGHHGLVGGHGWGGHGIGFIGGFFRFLFFGFLLMMFFKFLGFWRWRMHGGHGWQHHHHGPWGQHGPWQPGHPHGQQPGQPQPEQSPQSAPTVAQPEAHTPQPVSWVKV